jgi:hypothetical protein
MTANEEDGLLQALSVFREDLNGIEPSRGLEDRMDQAFDNWSKQFTRRPWRRVALFAAAASVILASIAVMITHHALRVADRPSISRWSPRPALMRVRGSVGAAPAARPIGTGAFGATQHYWLEVEIAADGTIRIVRAVPASDLSDLGTS